MDIASLIKAVKTGSSIVLSLRGTIESIEKEMQILNLDIADSHLKAAKDAIKASNYTSDVNATAREILTHLKGAYFVYGSAIDRIVKHKVLFIFLEDKPFLDYDKRLVAYKKQMEIGVLIALLYDFLKEPENKSTWKETVERVAVDYVNCRYSEVYADAIVTGKKKIENYYISKEERADLESFKNEKRYYRLNTGSTYEMSRYETTIDGENYLKSAKAKQLNLILSSFQNI